MIDKKYIEKNHLAIFSSGLAETESWANQHKPVEFHDLAGLVTGVLEKMNIEKYETSASSNPIFDYGLCLIKNNKLLVEYGKVKLSLTKNFEVKQEIFYADFNWDLLLNKTNDNIVIERASRFPEVRRDLSLVIDKGVQYKDIMNLAMKTERKLIKNIDVFDVYEGENLKDNKKAYSIKFILEDKEKTLTDKVIDKTMNRLMSAFKSNLGALIRQ